MTSLSLEWFKAFSSLLLGLAWPGAIVVLAWFFREDIRKKLAHVSEAGLAGVKFWQPLTSPPKLDSPAETPALPAPHRTALQQKIVDELKKELDQLPDDKQKIDALAGSLAFTRMVVVFRDIYANIFGSQVDALRQLATAGGTTTIDRAKAFFDEVKRLFPDFYRNADFDDWAKFLIFHKLVQVNGEQIDLTDYGREFLNYISVDRRGVTRPN
jgi:hypothetical protein